MVILALCYSAAGMDDSSLNIIRNGFRVLQRKGKPHIPSLLLGAKLCCKNPKHASEGIKFVYKAMKSFRSHEVRFISAVYHFLGVCYGPFARSSTCDSKKMRLQDDALRLLQDGTAMAKYTPEILYSLAWENAMQRKLNAAIDSAKECLDLVSGSSVSTWKLLILVLFAQQNLEEAEALADLALDEAEEEDQMGILRLKAQIQASCGQFKSAVESLRSLLAIIQAKKEVWKSTPYDKVTSLHISWRWKHGWIWHQYTQSLKRGMTQTSVLIKPNPSISCIQSAGMLKALYWKLSPCIKAAYDLRELSPIQDFSEQLPILLH